jgi:hypothetical protein
MLESEPELLLLTPNSKQTTLETDFPDERVKLLFVCAHPAIDPAMHTPLMLPTVLGLDALRIASAFLISPKTMGRRLVRAETKIPNLRAGSGSKRNYINCRRGWRRSLKLFTPYAGRQSCSPLLWMR